MTVSFSVSAGSISCLPAASTLMRNLRRSIEAVSSAIFMRIAHLPGTDETDETDNTDRKYVSR